MVEQAIAVIAQVQETSTTWLVRLIHSLDRDILAIRLLNPQNVSGGNHADNDAGDLHALCLASTRLPAHADNLPTQVVDLTQLHRGSRLNEAFFRRRVAAVAE